MPVFRSSPDPNPATGLPPARRISLPASERLSTITEGPRPARSAWRLQAPPRPSSSSRYAPSYTTNPNRWSSGNASQATTVRTAPPAYGWMPESISAEEDLRAPVEGEKLAQLRHLDNARRDDAHQKFRGGWGRLLIILAAVLIVLGVALGVGLGIGLKKHQSDSDENDIPPGSAQTSTAAPRPFPLGEYSMATALRSQDTACTSNAATWRCYVTYSPLNGATSNTSLATFNWALSNTSMTYPTNTTTATTTSAEGVDSNLTISSVDNPFAITFADKPLTYIHTSGNASSARLTFTFEMSKSVIPAAPITSNNEATVCFFNSTTFIGTLYLDSPATFPAADTADDPGVGGGYTPWPYAIEISQSSPSGTNVPACYLTANGDVGARILTGPAPVTDGRECACDYRNF